MPDISENIGLSLPLGNELFNRDSYRNNLLEIDQKVAAKAMCDSLQQEVSNLAGTGRTTETVKGNADAFNTHLADLAKHAILVGTDGKAAKNASTDWNDYKDAGFYYGNNLANQPTSPSGQSIWKYVTVIKHNDLYCIQICTDFSNTVTNIRACINGTWAAWKPLSYSDHNHDGTYAPLYSPRVIISSSTTLTNTHAGAFIYVNASSNITLTVSPDSTGGWTNYSEIEVAQIATGTVTFAPGSGVTIFSKDSKLTIDGRFAGASLKKIGANEWLLIGALA